MIDFLLAMAGSLILYYLFVAGVRWGVLLALRDRAHELQADSKEQP